MKRLQLSFMLVMVVMLIMVSFQKEVSAYNKEKWRMQYSHTSYKWGASLKDGLIKNGWKNGAASWFNKTSNSSKINFVYHYNSVNFLTRFTEKNSTYYGKMIVSSNNNRVVKFEGYLNDYAVKSANVAQSTAVHELGHTLGIAHNSSGKSIMDSSRNRSTMYVPQTDDINGSKAIYK